jgi:hypothetical protein
LRAVAVGDNLPRILRGAVTAYAVRGLDDMTMPDTSGGKGIVSALERAYRVAPADHTDAARDLVKQTGMQPAAAPRLRTSVRTGSHQNFRRKGMMRWMRNGAATGAAPCSMGSAHW